jgi:hypothetical protein
MSHKEATAVPKRFLIHSVVKITRTNGVTSGEFLLSGTLSAAWKQCIRKLIDNRMGKGE